MREHARENPGHTYTKRTSSAAGTRYTYGLRFSSSDGTFTVQALALSERQVADELKKDPSFNEKRWMAILADALEQLNHELALKNKYMGPPRKEE
jgi:hypothetical protein